MACASITDLANTIWYDLGQPSGQPPSYIQSRLVSPPYIGKLNNLLGTCYVSVSGDISPALGPDEQAIYDYLYQYDYYSTQLNRTLAGVNPGGVLSIADGDSRIVFVDPVNIARMYRDAKNSAYEELLTQTYAYRQANSQPSSVDLPLIINSLATYGGVYGGSVYNNPHNYYRS